jgi:hypothetical protein
MPKKQVWLIALLILMSALMGAVAASGLSFVSQAQAQRTTSAARPGPHRYEYHCYIAPGPQDLTDETNKLADDGWELTQVITDERVVTRYIGFYRREKR